VLALGSVIALQQGNIPEQMDLDTESLKECKKSNLEFGRLFDAWGRRWGLAPVLGPGLLVTNGVHLNKVVVLLYKIRVLTTSKMYGEPQHEASPPS
jgi:hypothetical protein